MNISYWCWLIPDLQTPNKNTWIAKISCVCSLPDPSSCPADFLIKWPGQWWKCYMNKDFLNPTIIFCNHPNTFLAFFFFLKNIKLNSNRDINYKEDYTYLTAQLQCYGKGNNKPKPLFVDTCKWAAMQKISPEAIIPSVCLTNYQFDAVQFSTW